MAREYLFTDEEVEAEIARLKESSYTKLAQKEKQIKYHRRQYMYTLRQLERRGKVLSSEGMTIELLERLCDVQSDYDEGGWGA